MLKSLLGILNRSLIFKISRCLCRFQLSRWMKGEMMLDSVFTEVVAWETLVHRLDDLISYAESLKEKEPEPDGA
jgi:hypothetical protein